MPDRRGFASCSVASGCALAGLLASLPGILGAATWRIGDGDQPWRTFPVSYRLDAGEVYRHDYIWGGPHAVEIAVDDDGDGLVDEDPVEIVDNDGDGLFNEDPADGIDSDRDGLVDEDGVEAQFDNDGDGLLNEDGMRTGGVVYDPALRAQMESPPFERYPTQEAASGDPEGHGTGWGDGGGYGWGDDDRDVNFNEDDLDGIDNDGDGLVDEDPPGPPIPLPGSLLQVVFAYEGDDYTEAQRRAIRFFWDESSSLFVGEGPRGEVTAVSGQRRLTPTDWLRPIRLDETRNLSLLTADRLYSGELSADPTNSSNWNSGTGGSAHADARGHGIVADGDIFTARTAVGRAFWGGGYHIHFNALYWLDLIRLRPRPDFPERTPTTFDIWYAGDREAHFRTNILLGELVTKMDVRDPIVPRQTDRIRPAIKEYRFGEGEEFEPVKARILQFESWMSAGESWELAEFQVYGHGYALDAAYTTEIIDVGAGLPRFRRYFDPHDPDRPIAMEKIQTVDSDDDGTISASEQASAVLAGQFDPEAPGSPVTWGRVRWHGRREGEANAQVRVRSGSTLDTRIYQRKVGRGLLSPFVGSPIVEDWPARGSRLDVTGFLQLSGLQRPLARDLPLNLETDRDGVTGGWTPWSAPLDFADGLVPAGAESGGVPLPLPPLHRYIQFRVDFESGEDAGVSLDYIEFDFADPVVSRGVLAEIFPATAGALGSPLPFRYVLRPDLTAGDAGFDRIEIAVPSPQAAIDSLLVDDLRWQRIVPTPPDGLSETAASEWIQERLTSRAWLDTTAVSGDRFAAATYFDPESGSHRIAIKTRLLTSADFPRGQDREMEVALTTPLFRLLTGFNSWVWNQALRPDLQQPTQPGNASDRLPSDAVRVTVHSAGGVLEIRELAPNPFTPNGDGLNDAAAWILDLFMLTSPAGVSVTIYDLDGRQVRRLEELASSGQLAIEWDGRDESGESVLPGIYLYRLFVDSDTGTDNELLGTVAVAY